MHAPTGSARRPTIFGPFTVAITLSAFLLFNIEPLFGRMLLPLAGGSPAVWNTAMVAFQTLLLGGYCYAHLLQRWLPPRRQAVVHLCLAAAAIGALPIQVDALLAGRANDEPIVTVLLVLLRGVGLPFFVLSATGPLLQAWFAASSRDRAERSYSLYAASNAGSLAGLLAYPLILEPFSGIRFQTTLWTVGFGGFLACLAAVAAILLRGVRLPTPTLAARDDKPEPGRMRQRLRWIVFAAIPSSFMLAVTTELTTQIAPLPLLWVLPLALYLLTFILAFAERSPFSSARARGVLARLFVMLVLLCAMTTGLNKVLPAVAEIVLLCALFFVTALRAHMTVYAERPAASRLTEFYLCLAFGSVLAGLLNALVAPLIFRDVYEFGLTVIAACICFAPTRPRRPPPAVTVAAALLLVSALIGGAVVLARGGAAAVVSSQLLMALIGVVLFVLSDARHTYAAAVAAVFAVGVFWPSIEGRALLQSRNFFGEKRVTVSADGTLHYLVHSGTVHGAESTLVGRECTPQGYYARSGPIGHFFASTTGVAARSVAAVGLGVGTLAAYVRPGVRWTFYEIDPAVRDIASNDDYFRYYHRCGGEPPVVIGDARLSLQRSTERYDVIILDAFTSDQVPVHIITREAASLYLAHLRPHGVLAFHISNRYFDFTPVFANLARDAGLVAITETRLPTAEQAREGVLGTQWVLLAREAQTLESVRAHGDWRMLRTRDDIPLWTDDYSSLIRLLR